MRTIPAHVTVYNGTRYRSRLEARWAAMFDQLGWSHTYEPDIALRYYIPDFTIDEGEVSVLIECKPSVAPFTDAATIEACRRIERSGYLGARAHVIGSTLFVTREEISSYVYDDPEDESTVLVDPTFRYAPLPELEVRRETSYLHRICIGRGRTDLGAAWSPCYLARSHDKTVEGLRKHEWFITTVDASAALSSEDFRIARFAWAEAGNLTQWRKPE